MATSKQLLERAERASAKMTFADMLKKRRQIIGPSVNKLIGDARAAHEALTAGKEPTPVQLAALERAIRLQRPAPTCAADKRTPLGDEDSPFDDVWPAFQAVLQRLQRAVARLDRIDGTSGMNGSRQPLGTGFLVAPNRILTARHVIEDMSYDTMRLEPGQAIADFGKYWQSNAGETCVITGVVAVDHRFDLGLLEIEPLESETDSLVIDGFTVTKGAGVCVVGYPLDDRRSGMVNVDFIFGKKRFGLKRASVGEILRSDAYYHYHDCSTLGGNSGSPVVDLDSGRFCGVHVSGRALARNAMVRAVHVLEFFERHRETPAGSAHTSCGGGRIAIVGGSDRDAQTADDAELDEIEELEARPEDYVDRPGYDPGFLGVEVPLPEFSRNGDDILTFEFGDDEQRELRYQHFSVVMSESRRMCRFSAVNIDGATAGKRKRRGWRFDPRIDKAHQIMKECYGREPKFSRGHMTRREDPIWGSDTDASTGNVDSMHVTNAVPQIQPFNAGIWLQLESYALDHTREDSMRISVFTGPFLTGDDPVHFGVRIPLRFWKVIAFIHDETGELSATGYTMSQEPFIGDSEFVFGQHQNRQRPILEIEREAGITFGELSQVDPLRTLPESTDRLLSAPGQIRFI